MTSENRQAAVRTEADTKSTLSPSQRQLIELMQSLNFGRIEGLRVRGGDPVFNPAPRVIRKLKIGGDNGPRPEATHQDFRLKQQNVEMLEAMVQLDEGEVMAIEVKHGLAFAMEIEQRPVDIGGSRG